VQSNYGSAEALAQRARLVKSAMERREGPDPDLATEQGRYVAPRRVSVR